MTEQSSSLKPRAATDPPRADGPRRPYRILLPLDRSQGHGPALFRFALALAQALNGEVLALHVVTPGEEHNAADLPLPELDALPSDEPFAYQLITHASEGVASGIVEVAQARRCDLILLHWERQPRALRNRLGHILDPVIEDAPCGVALLKGELPEVAGTQGPRILLPVRGGPHARSAAQLALALARHVHGAATVVTVIPEAASAAEEAEAERLLDEITQGPEAASEAADFPLVKRVIRASEVEPALVSAARNHDLVFLGASNDSVVNQLLLGSVVERLAEALPQPVVVVKRYQGLTQFWLRRLWRRVDVALPRISSADRLDAYKRIRRGARATVDFYTLMLCSVVIATMGLLLNSGAVIIGAMLVAPLMTPILALGLGVVMGDTRLLRIAATSTAKGVLMAVAVSVLLTLVAPLVLFTVEIESRTQPNLFDLTVALAAGLAGAYSVSRKGVGAALPGVAIAAALVPPLAVVGICLATSRWEAARGAALLFGTNLVTIAFAAALVYLLLGFFPQEEERARQAVLRRGFLVILALLFFVAVPLARSLAQVVNETAISRTMESTLRETLRDSELSLFNFEWDMRPGEPITLRVVVYAAGEVAAETFYRLDDAVTNAVGQEVNVRLVIIRTDELRDDGAPRLGQPR